MLKLIVKAYRYGNLKNKLYVSKGCCLYSETCSKYAERVILEKGEFKAFILILQRLLLCNPLGYKTIGKYLYEGSNIHHKEIARRKARLILTTFLCLIIPMQITSIILIKNFFVEPLLSIDKDIKSNKRDFNSKN